MTYALLFVLGFSSEFLLTSYYINAARGKQWLCVVLGIVQYWVWFTTASLNLIEVEPRSLEQIKRMLVTTLAFGTATYFVVGREKKKINGKTLSNS